MGFGVVPSKDGAEAYTRAWETHPDIIVTGLPNYDGWEFLQHLNVALAHGTFRLSLSAATSNRCTTDPSPAGLRRVFRNPVRRTNLQMAFGRCSMARAMRSPIGDLQPGC